MASEEQVEEDGKEGKTERQKVKKRQVGNMQVSFSAVVACELPQHQNGHHLVALLLRAVESYMATKTWLFGKTVQK